MPLLCIQNKLVYFAHVPKCGGTSVEAYLEARFGTRLALKDSQFKSLPARGKWSKSSPQHIPLDALKRMFPLGFFDHMFALVRHPVDRIASAYLFQVEVEKTVASDTSFSDWLEQVRVLRSRSPYAYDTHIRPVSDFIPTKHPIKLFRLEDGMSPVIAWLDTLAGSKGVLARWPRSRCAASVPPTRNGSYRPFA